MLNIQLSFWQKINHPSFKTLAVLLGLFCVVPVAVFEVLPGLVGALAGWAFGMGDTPVFLARHENVYAFVQDLLRGGYVLLSVGILDFLFLVWVYRLLDDTITRQGKWRGVLAVALRAFGPLFWRQACVGIALCVLLWWADGFSSLTLLPVFFSSEISAGIVMAVWSVSLILFACGFAVTESGSEALRFGRLLFKTYRFSWVVCFIVTLLLVWFPALVFAKFGVTGSAVLSICFTLHNSILLFCFLTAFLIWFFNKPEVFAIDTPAEGAEQDPLNN